MALSFFFLLTCLQFLQLQPPPFLSHFLNSDFMCPKWITSLTFTLWCGDSLFSKAKIHLCYLPAQKRPVWRDSERKPKLPHGLLGSEEGVSSQILTPVSITVAIFCSTLFPYEPSILRTGFHSYCTLSTWNASSHHFPSLSLSPLKTPVSFLMWNTCSPSWTCALQLSNSSAYVFQPWIIIIYVHIYSSTSF